MKKLNKEDFIGRKFSRLTIVDMVRTPGKVNVEFLVRCECGNEKIVALGSLKRGATKSCGCLKKETAGKASLTHGLSKHPLYSIYNKIIWRCYYIKASNYAQYGGEGVRMCDEWLNDFQSFYDWAIANGWRKGLDVDKDIKAAKLGVKADLYSPDRCSIVTRQKNCEYRRNKRIIFYKNESKNITQLAREHNIPENVLNNRIKTGWPIGEALSTPVMKRGNEPSKYRPRNKQPEIRYAFGFIG